MSRAHSHRRLRLWRERAAESIRQHLGKALWALLGAAAVSIYQGVWHRVEDRAIREVIEQEGKLALEYPHSEDNIRRYRELFTEDAVASDVRQGVQWSDRERILERFQGLHFRSLKHKIIGDPLVQIGLLQKGEAEANTITEFEVAGSMAFAGMHFSDYEVWHLEKRDGRWRVSSFEFDLPSRPHQ